MRVEVTSFAVEEEADGQTVHVRGVIDENADLSFFAGLHGTVTVNLRSVRRINSYGVRSWIEGIRLLPPDAQLLFVECPPPVVDQVNMVAGFLGSGRVESFYAPMACRSCGHEMDALFDVATCQLAGGRVPAVTCPKCGSAMEVDDLEDQYLLFVRES
jgi:anti-anti-sigma regulatory factor